MKSLSTSRIMFDLLFICDKNVSNDFANPKNSPYFLGRSK